MTENGTSGSVERFEHHIAFLNLRGVRIAGLFGGVAVPAFSILDYFVVKPIFVPLLILRLTAAAISVAAIVLSYGKNAKKFAFALSATVFLSVYMSIAVMVHAHDNLFPDKSPSHYYAGLCLVLLGTAQLSIWSVRQRGVVFSIMYLAYVLPTLIFQWPSDWIMYLSNNFFLVTTIFLVWVGHGFTYRLQRQEFYSSLELEKANKELGNINEKLTELDRYKTQFFSNITHELKTPLTLIIAPTEAILRGDMGDVAETYREYFRRIYQNGLKLMKLISDLLDLAKLEDSKLRLKLDQFDLHDLLTSLVGTISPLAERKRISMRLEVFGQNTLIWADKSRMEQVFINLLSNAVKFTGETGNILLSLDARGELLKVTVRDSGIGIPADKLEIIFDRFSQVDGSSTRKYGGTGIGLALARELVTLHNGKISVESTPGVGTTFQVDLRRDKEHFSPDILDRRVARSDVSRDRRQDEKGIPEWWEQLSSRDDFKLLDIDNVTDRRKALRDVKDEELTHLKRVLVAEDSKEMLEFLEFQLRDKYKVYLAENGRIGWELVSKFKPDIVISDYMMPEMDGLELTRTIKTTKETSHIPVIMLTAKSGLTDRLAGREAGADQYLAKPFSPAELLLMVEKLLSSQDEQTDKIVSQRLDSLQVIAGRLAHEIHNPVNYIRNGALLIGKTFEKYTATISSEMIEADPQGAAKRDGFAKRIERMLEQVKIGTERISNAVELLKEYSREGYKPVPSDYEVDLGIKRVIDLVSTREGSKRNIHFEPVGVGTIQCVAQEFHEVISNLIQNAMDATAVDGNVWVTAVRNSDHVEIQVRDDGAGIAQEHLDRIFNPLFTTKGPGQGMGMGLTITYQLLKKAGGKIRVSSQIGKGTCFTVSWPLVIQETQAG